MTLVGSSVDLGEDGEREGKKLLINISSFSFFSLALPSPSRKQVTWFEQQVELKRRKRDAILLEDLRNNPLTSSSYLNQHYLSTLLGYNFPDPLYSEQWYLVSFRAVDQMNDTCWRVEILLL